MNFTKKLIVLTGKEGRGTALIECNGMGTFVTLNVFSLPDLRYGEYALGVKTGRVVLSRDVGSLGRIRTRLQLPDGDYDAVHLVLFNAATDEPLLYGTSSERRMWEGNQMDGLRRGERDKKESGVSGEAAQAFAYSGLVGAAGFTRINTGVGQETSHEAVAEKTEKRDIRDFFLDIDPPSGYADGAVAAENYYAFARDKDDASQGEDAQSETEDAHEPQNAPQSVESSEPDHLPSEYERAYLTRRFSVSVACAAATAPPQTASAEETFMDGLPLSRKLNKDVEETDRQTTAGATESFDETIPSSRKLNKEVEDTTTQTSASAADSLGQNIPSLRRVKKASEYSAQEAAGSVKTACDYYARVKDKLDRLFGSEERCAPLDAALPGTKWVRVPYDGQGRYYVVGLIGQNPDFIAYGVPGKYGTPLLEGADFIPTDGGKPTGDGYWVLFQSARTGEEIVK